MDDWLVLNCSMTSADVKKRAAVNKQYQETQDRDLAAKWDLDAIDVLRRWCALSEPSRHIHGGIPHEGAVESYGDYAHLHLSFGTEAAAAEVARQVKSWGLHVRQEDLAV